MAIKDLEIYAVRFHNNKPIAFKADYPDIITYSKMWELMQYDGYTFYIMRKGKRMDFKLERFLFCPWHRYLKEMEQF